MSVSKNVNRMKSYTTYHIGERYLAYLRKHFGKEHTFGTDGWIFCVQCGECFGHPKGIPCVRNAAEIHRKPKIGKTVEKMLKAYKYRIYPNKAQEELLAKTFGCCRFVCNQTLAYRKEK